MASYGDESFRKFDIGSRFQKIEEHVSEIKPVIGFCVVFHNRKLACPSCEIRCVVQKKLFHRFSCFIHKQGSAKMGHFFESGCLILF